MSETTIPVSCNKDCGGGCPLLAYVEHGRVTKITDNPLGGPYKTGCAKGFQMIRALYAPDRLQRPLLRTGPRGSGEFKEISWPHALDVVTKKLSGIKSRYGNESILSLGGSGSCRGALHNTHRLAKRFLNLFGGHIETTGNYSTAAASFTVPYVLGTLSAGIDASTLQFSNLIILWGANIADTQMGCEAKARIREAKARGIDVIVIDPRRSASAATLGTQWIPVRPGTDTALMMAVLYVLLDENLTDTAFMTKYSTGFDKLKQHVLGLTGSEARTPQWAESICGTPAETIIQLARQYGRTRPTALIPGLSIQRTIGGEEATRMAIVLQVATGNLGIPGGSSGSPMWNKLPGPRMGAIAVPPNPIQSSVPEYRWPDVILEGKQGGYPNDIKAIYNVGGNYLVQGSDVHKNIRAFAKVEFSVCHDYALTPTAQHCDVVLPTTTFLERDDIVFPSDGNYLLFSNQAVPPQHEAKNDYDIFCELADRLGFLSQFSENKSSEEWLESFCAESEVPDYKEFKRAGIYMGENQARVGLSDFIADPQTHPLNTPSSRIEISSMAYAKTGYSSIPECRILQTDDHYPLRLVTPHPKFRIHSQYDNIPWFKEREKQALWIHPHDAAQRDIKNNHPVHVTSPEGRMRIPARVTEDIMPGVVCLLEGVWPCFDPDGTENAGSVNVLTCTVPTLPSNGSRTHSVLVEVARI
ncbi:MAG: molybdopterin-dependent oxidoreductase [Chloroflexi bacterium]|nr:molybdopterin-dependent oxidoreductase [Chloroflexota bacterium]